MLIPVWYICICRFLCSVSLLAQKRNLLEDIIVTKNFSEEGLYQVRLCKDGNWKTVIVDDRFPCDRNGNLKYSRVRAGLSIENQIQNCPSPKQWHHSYHVIFLKFSLAHLEQKGFLLLKFRQCLDFHPSYIFYKFWSFPALEQFQPDLAHRILASLQKNDSY